MVVLVGHDERNLGLRRARHTVESTDTDEFAGVFDNEGESVDVIDFGEMANLRVSQSRVQREVPTIDRARRKAFVKLHEQ